MLWMLRSSIHYRERLLALRGRIARQAGHLIEAIEETFPTGEGSGAPVHLADIAPNSPDAETAVLTAQDDALESIDAALARIGRGTFGKCGNCGADIGPDRLEAIPYAAKCVGCARNEEQMTADEVESSLPIVPDEDGFVLLRGFLAIEYAEKEGLPLSKDADNIDAEANNLTIAEAEAIAVERADLIWVKVPAGEFYGEQRTWNPPPVRPPRRN